MAEKTIGLLGFGHIGQAIAARAKAFEMKVHVANRSPVQASPLIDRSFTLDQLPSFWASADFFVTSVPLAPETKGIIGTEAFAAMLPHAVLVNVGRGPTVDETALFDALRTNRIAGAVIDTWYTYPSAASPEVHPSSLPFHDAAERRDDATHVGLDARHDPAAEAHDRRQYRATPARRALCQRRAASAARLKPACRGGPVRVRAQASDGIDHQLIGDVVGADALAAPGTAELGDAALGTLEAAGAAAVDDGASGVEALAVPGARGSEGEPAAIGTVHLAGNVEDAPGPFVARMQVLDNVDLAAVQVAALQRDLVGNLDAVHRLTCGLLADPGVEGDVATQRLGRCRRSQQGGGVRREAQHPGALW